MYIYVLIWIWMFHECLLRGKCISNYFGGWKIGVKKRRVKREEAGGKKKKGKRVRQEEKDRKKEKNKKYGFKSKTKYDIYSSIFFL